MAINIIREMTVPEGYRRFAEDVSNALAQDPMPTFARLAAASGVPVEDLVHYALVRWAASGAEMLMEMPPLTLRDLLDARRREDWGAVAGIIDWLAAGS